MYRVDEQAGSGWDEAYTALHGDHDVLPTASATPDSSRGRLAWQQTDRYRLAWCGGVDQRVARGTRHVRRDPRGAYELLVPLRGKALVTAGGTTSPLSAGMGVLCDMDRPLHFSHGADFESIALVVPQPEVATRDRGLEGAPTVIDTSKGIGALVRQLAVSLHDERHDLDQQAFDASCDGLLDLAALAAAGASRAPETQHASVADAVRGYVRAHAHEPDLDVHRVARALGWSPRHIQGVLQAEETTTRDLIRSQRLELARSRLSSRQWAEVTVADIASASGFSTHSMFSSAFRAEFGRTPSAIRATADPIGSAPDVQTGEPARPER
ncbi:MAG: AraC family transcriptional regulator [Janthinobacterium lividum]